MSRVNKPSFQLKVVLYTQDTESPAVLSSLEKLPYPIQIFDPDQLNSFNPQKLPSIMVIAIGNEQLDCNKVCTLCTCYPEIPKLAVFVGGANIRHKDIIDNCCEFISLPCHSGELQLRMDKLEAMALSNYALGNAHLVGRSEVFTNILKLMSMFSRCDAPVLIEGETGTGKEMVARAIHYQSNRKDYPFIPVNCGALPDNLIENELFGHIKGAYTDAKSTQAGLVAQAESGTLFLDEIEALSHKAQVVLLRFLQEFEYKPLGGSRTYKANVRIIAASNAKLCDLVEQGVIRQDLYFRLNILALPIPSLKERGEDIHLLAEWFLNQFTQQYDLSQKYFNDAALRWMSQYNWPGNVRELENLVHRAVLVSEGDEISLQCIVNESEYVDSTEYSKEQDWSAEVQTNISFNEAKTKAIDTFEKYYLSHLMRQAKGNVTLAAKQACKERRALGKLLKKHGIDRNLFS